MIQVIVDTPRGSRNKYKYDKQTRQLNLSKVMPEGMIFPFDFGFIPETEGEDGDPLDVLVLIDEPTFPGCQVECRLIGVIEAEQEQSGASVSALKDARLDFLDANDPTRGQQFL